MSKQKTIKYCIDLALSVKAIKEGDRKFMGELLAVAYSDGKMAGFNEATELRKEYMTEEQLIEKERESKETVTISSEIL